MTNREHKFQPGDEFIIRGRKGTVVKQDGYAGFAPYAKVDVGTPCYLVEVPDLPFNPYKEYETRMEAVKEQKNES